MYTVGSSRTDVSCGAAARGENGAKAAARGIGGRRLRVWGDRAGQYQPLACQKDQAPVGLP